MTRKQLHCHARTEDGMPYIVMVRALGATSNPDSRRLRHVISDAEGVAKTTRAERPGAALEGPEPEPWLRAHV